MIIAEIIIVVLGRFITTIGLIKGLELCGYKSGIRLKDLVFISYAGTIRGAVALGLVLRIEHVPHRQVIVTTSLSLVVFTTVFLGGTVSLM